MSCVKLRISERKVAAAAMAKIKKDPNKQSIIVKYAEIMKINLLQPRGRI